jgi:hypothetical protein
MACSVKKIVVVCVLVMFNLGIYAQTTKVVVIPTEGDNPASQFRIESAGTSTEESLERLEYTAGLPRTNLKQIEPSWTSHTGISLFLPQFYTENLVGTGSSLPTVTGALLDSKEVNCRHWTSSSSGDNYDYGASGYIGPWWTHTSPTERDWRFMHDSFHCAR